MITLEEQKSTLECERKHSQELEELRKKWEKDANEKELQILNCELHIRQHKQKNEVLEAAEGYLQIKLSQIHQQLLDTKIDLNSKEDSLKIAEQHMQIKHQEMVMSEKKKDEYLLWNRTLQQQVRLFLIS